MKILIVDYIDFNNLESLNVLHQFLKQGNVIFILNYDIYFQGCFNSSGNKYHYDEKVRNALLTLIGNDYNLFNNLYGSRNAGIIVDFKIANVNENEILVNNNIGYAINRLFPSENISIFINYILENDIKVDVKNIITISNQKDIVQFVNQLGGKGYQVEFSNDESKYEFMLNEICSKKIGKMIINLKNYLLCQFYRKSNLLSTKLPISDGVSINSAIADVMFADIQGTLLPYDSYNENELTHINKILINYLQLGNILVLVTSGHGDVLDAYTQLSKVLYDVPQEVYNQIYMFKSGNHAIVYGDTFHQFEIECKDMDLELTDLNIISSDRKHNIPFNFTNNRKDTIIDPFLRFLIKNGCQPLNLYAVGDDPFADLSMLIKVRQMQGKVGFINKIERALQTINSNAWISEDAKQKLRSNMESISNDVYPSFIDFANQYSIGRKK